MPTTIERETLPDWNTSLPGVILHVEGHTWRSFNRYLWWSQHPGAGVVPEQVADTVGPGKDVTVRQWLLSMVQALAEDLTGQHHYSHRCDECQ